MFNPYLGMIGPSDSYFSSGLKTPTRSNQCFFLGTKMILLPLRYSFDRKPQTQVPHKFVCVSTPGQRVLYHYLVSKTNFGRGVQHLWSTARNEAKTTDGKGSRTLDPVPAD